MPVDSVLLKLPTGIYAFAADVASAAWPSMCLMLLMSFTGYQSY